MYPDVEEARVDEVRSEVTGCARCSETWRRHVAAGSGAVGHPEVVAVGVEHGVALALEGGLSGGVPEEEAGVLEPAAEVGLFGLALGVGEAGDGGDAVGDDGGVGDEDHVRCAWTMCSRRTSAMRRSCWQGFFHWAKALSREGRCRLPAIQGLMT